MQCNSGDTQKQTCAIKSNDFAHRIQCAINLNKYVQNKIKTVQYTNTHLHTIQLCKNMNNTLCKTDQYFEE